MDIQEWGCGEGEVLATSMNWRNGGLDEAQAGIKIAGRNVSNLRYADDTTLMAESEEELESLDESERGEWKNCLKTQNSKKLREGGTIWENSIETYILPYVK